MARKPAPSFTFSPRSQQGLPRRLLAILILAVFVSLPLLRGGKEPAGDHEMEGAVKYVEVPSGRGNVRRYAAVQNSTGEPVSIRSWMSVVASDSPEGIQVADRMSEAIRSSPYSSLLFETPGTSWNSSRGDRFEFALVDEPALGSFAEGNPDRRAFKEHFRSCDGGGSVCSFASLGGDARLVAPLPREGVADSSYSHLAAFVRNAGPRQLAEFWRVGAQQYLKILERNHEANPKLKTWFSTNGMGVAWLHLRLDSRPKYYSYEPFAITRE